MKNRSSCVLVSAALVTTTGVGCGKKSDASGDPTGAGSAAAASPGLSLGSLGPLAGFEGAITVSVRSAKDPKPQPPMTLEIKGGKIRFDAPEGFSPGRHTGSKAHFVMDAPEKKVFTVVDEERMVVLLDIGTLGNQLKTWNPSRDTEPPSPPRVTKTGRMATVAGYQCEDWEIVSPRNERTTLCVANQGASWLDLPSLGLAPDQAWAKEIMDGRHLPLRFIGYAEDGTEDVRVEAVKIEKKSIPDAEFAIPPGYRTMDLAESMRGAAAALQGVAAGQLPAGAKLPPEVLEKLRAAAAAMPSAK